MWLPAALKYGVPYEAFWKMNPKRLKPFQDAYNQKMQDEADKINYSCWLMGQYMVCAIQKALEPKKSKYPDQPFGMQGNNGDEDSDISAIKFGEFADAFNHAFKKK